MKTPYIVAEIGAAHNGSFDRAIALVSAAHAAGADAVKFQYWTEMALPGHVIADGPWKGHDLHDLYEEARTPYGWLAPLFDYARKLGITPFASVFDREGVDVLEALDCPMYKIASAEIVDLPLIEYAASKGKPMVLSTGMATIDEVDEAAHAASGGGGLTLLHCVSAYPARVEDVNLVAMLELGENVGLSDHTLGSTVAIAATALCATMIEKHIGLDREGLDGGFVTLPGEFKAFVAAVRGAAAAMGDVRYGPLPSEASTLALRRSLWVVRDVKRGDSVTRENVRSLRPAGGLLPSAFDKYEGAAFTRDVAAGEPLIAAMLHATHSLDG